MKNFIFAIKRQKIADYMVKYIVVGEFDSKDCWTKAELLGYRRVCVLNGEKDIFAMYKNDLTIQAAEDLLQEYGQKFSEINGVTAVGITTRQGQLKFVITCEPQINATIKDLGLSHGETIGGLEVVLEEAEFVAVGLDSGSFEFCPANMWDNVRLEDGYRYDGCVSKCFQFFKVLFGIRSKSLSL